MIMIDAKIYKNAKVQGDKVTFYKGNKSVEIQIENAHKALIHTGFRSVDKGEYVSNLPNRSIPYTVEELNHVR